MAEMGPSGCCSLRPSLETSIRISRFRATGRIILPAQVNPKWACPGTGGATYTSEELGRVQICILKFKNNTVGNIYVGKVWVLDPV